MFGQKQIKRKPDNKDSISFENEIRENTNQLWQLLRDTVAYYNSIACPCAFPRFIQYTSIDCSDTHNSYYVSETEGFIQASVKCFNIEYMDKGDECQRAIYTCKTCGSTYLNAWSDFSIIVSRTYLKPIKITANQIGADAVQPIPLFVGLYGHSIPDVSNFRRVGLEEFKGYIQALKQTGDTHLD